MIIQILLAIMGGIIIWEGSKGFRQSGIKIGIFKAGGEPLTGTKGRVVGGVVVAIGVALVLFALVIWPLIIGI